MKRSNLAVVEPLPVAKEFKPLPNSKGHTRGLTTCTVPGCSRPHQGRGMCGAHQSRWARGIRGAEFLAPILKRAKHKSRKQATRRKTATRDASRLFAAACSINQTTPAEALAELMKDYSRKAFELALD